MVELLFSSTGDVGAIPGQGAQIPPSSAQPSLRAAAAECGHPDWMVWGPGTPGPTRSGALAPQRRPCTLQVKVGAAKKLFFLMWKGF